MRRGIAALVLASCALVSCGDGDEHGGGRPPASPAGVHIDVLRPSGLEAGDIVGAGSNLVALGSFSSPATVSFSEDGGASWRPSTVPRERGMDTQTQWRVRTIADRTFVVGGWVRPGPATDAELPFVWVSDDEGRTFIEAAGVFGDLPSGEVRDLFDLGDRLVALGYERGSKGGLRWESTDRGSSWTVSEVAGLDADSQYLWSSAVAGSTLWVGLGNRLLRSDDRGRTFMQVRPSRDRAALDIQSLAATGSRVTVGAYEATWVTDDRGRTWRELAAWPDSAGSAAVEVEHASDDGLVGVTNTFGAGAISRSDLLLWSGDDGRTWKDADPHLRCPGYEGPDADVRGPVAAGGVLVAVWSCTGSETRLLTSTDNGRSWKAEQARWARGAELGTPVVVGGRALVIGSSDAWQHLDLLLRIGPDR